MKENCDICGKEGTKHVLRFHVAYDLFFELDTCESCRHQLWLSDWVFERVDGI